MEVFNKVLSQVSSSVSSTVSQLSGVLPGNPVTREFESSAHVASAGTGKIKYEIIKLNVSYWSLLCRLTVENLQRL